ncbi:MAG: 30S ribosome-binding factor RbfA [Candidatus Omnitrophota bacterium]
MGRMERINQLIKIEIGNIIQKDLADPRLQFVSVTKVRVTPDLQEARVGFSVLGGRERVAEAEAVLQRVAGIVRRLISQRVTLRHTPRVEFVYDPSIEYSSRVEEVLDDIQRAEQGGSPDSPADDEEVRDESV